MPRTTLNLDPAVVRELHQRSKREQISLGELASRLLARELSEESGPERRPFTWVSRDLGRPAVDLEDKEALNTLLDQ